MKMHMFKLLYRGRIEAKPYARTDALPDTKVKSMMQMSQTDNIKDACLALAQNFVGYDPWMFESADGVLEIADLIKVVYMGEG